LPYRIAADPWGTTGRAVAVEARDRPARVVQRFGLIVAGAGAIMLLTFGIDLALRPTLGPDDVPDREPFAFRLPLAIEVAYVSHCGRDEDPSEREYDANRALLSDEPMDPEIEPEGTGPARRRYVRPDPRDIRSSGVIHGTTRLVGY
jgi:hypothetical protein